MKDVVVRVCGVECKPHIEEAIKMSASNIRLTPYEYGASMARSGLDFYFPYACDKNNALYKQGYYSVKKDVA